MEGEGENVLEWYREECERSEEECVHEGGGKKHNEEVKQYVEENIYVFVKVKLIYPSVQFKEKKLSDWDSRVNFPGHEHARLLTPNEDNSKTNDDNYYTHTHTHTHNRSPSAAHPSIIATCSNGSKYVMEMRTW